MKIKLVSTCLIEDEILESSFLFSNNKCDSCKVEYETQLLSFLFDEKSKKSNYLFYFERFPSTISKIRSYKWLKNNNDGNIAYFEKKIVDNESYLGLCQKVGLVNSSAIFDYYYLPNNCCLIKSEFKGLEGFLIKNVFNFNFCKSLQKYWIDYHKLLRIMGRGSYLYSFYVNPRNEDEFGVMVYQLV